MKTTFAELGEKIAKKIGKFEEDLKSTEPDVKNTAERTLPKLKQAMEQLMQSNEQEKAIKESGERQAVLAKGGPTSTEDYLASGAGNSINGKKGLAGMGLLDSNNPKEYIMGDLTDGQVDLTGGQGPYDASGINPTGYGIETIGEDGGGGEPEPPAPEDENSTLKNLYSAAQNAMVTAPFGYDYGPTDYYEATYNPAEEQSLEGLNEMERQVANAKRLAEQDTMLDTSDQRMAAEKGRQRNLRAAQSLTGAARFGAQQMANANAKDSMMQIGGQKARQEAMMNSGAAKSQRLLPIAAQQAQIAQMRNAIGGQRAQQDSYAQEHGLKTDAAMNSLEMGKLSNMSKWAQMQQLMANKQGMDERSFQAMMNMYSDPAIREMYGKIGK
jgi:hypothetical protein